MSAKLPIATATVLATILLVMFIPNALAKDPRTRPAHHKPPQEAFDACVSANTEDACLVTTRRGGEVPGRCLLPPQMDVLVCVPEHHRQSGQDAEPRDQ